MSYDYSKLDPEVLAVMDEQSAQGRAVTWYGAAYGPMTVAITKDKIKCEDVIDFAEMASGMEPKLYVLLILQNLAHAFDLAEKSRGTV